MDSNFKLAEKRMRTITTALAVFVLCTSSTHLIRMATPGLTGPDSAFNQNRFVKGPPLTSLRLPDGRFHVDVSYMAKPFLIYGLHLLPAFVWTIIAPLQFNTDFRNRHRQIHRASGYVFFAISAQLDITGLYMIATRFTYSPANRAHLHFGFLPTFDLGLTSLGIVFGVSLVIALNAAARKPRDLARHRIFTIVHTCAGLTVHYERVLLYAQWAVSYLLAGLSPRLFERLVGLPAQWDVKYVKEIGLLELDAFTITSYGGLLLAGLTAWYALYPILSSQGGGKAAKPYAYAAPIEKKSI